MAGEAIRITDRLGNLVIFTPEFLSGMEEVLRQKLMDAVFKPAMIIAGANGQQLLHYYRSADWHQTLLLTAERNEHHWEASSYLLNPTSDTIAALLKKGRQLL